jgi:hypothetical protein
MPAWAGGESSLAETRPVAAFRVGHLVVLEHWARLVDDTGRHLASEPEGLAREAQVRQPDRLALLPAASRRRREVKREVRDGRELGDADVVRRRRGRGDEVESLGRRRRRKI